MLFIEVCGGAAKRLISDLIISKWISISRNVFSDGNCAGEYFNMRRLILKGGESIYVSNCVKDPNTVLEAHTAGREGGLIVGASILVH